MSTNKVVLYNFWKSSCSWRVRMALKFKNIEYEYVAIDLLKNENKSDKYKKISPLGHVPALLIDNYTLYESLPICEYLEETRTNIGLPFYGKNANSFQRVKIREFCEAINAFIQPLQQRSVLQSTKDILMKQELTEQQKNHRIKDFATFYIGNGLKTLENILINNSDSNNGEKYKYCFSNEPCLADIFLVPQMFNATQVYNIQITDYPYLHQIYDELMKLPQFDSTQPQKQIDYDGSL